MGKPAAHTDLKPINLWEGECGVFLIVKVVVERYQYPYYHYTLNPVVLP